MKWVLALVLALTATHASAFDAKQLAKFKATNSCKNCDLSKANLSGADLEKADLKNAMLCKTKMPWGI